MSKIELDTKPPITDEEIIQRVMDMWANSKNGYSPKQFIELTLRLKNESIKIVRESTLGTFDMPTKTPESL